MALRESLENFTIPEVAPLETILLGQPLSLDASFNFTDVVQRDQDDLKSEDPVVSVEKMVPEMQEDEHVEVKRTNKRTRPIPDNVSEKERNRIVKNRRTALTSRKRKQERKKYLEDEKERLTKLGFELSAQERVLQKEKEVLLEQMQATMKMISDTPFIQQLFDKLQQDTAKGKKKKNKMMSATSTKDLLMSMTTKVVPDIVSTGQIA